MRGNARKSAAGRALVDTPTQAEIEAYRHLQDVFASPTMLHHADPKRPLFVDLDASKEWGFGAHVYHVRDDDTTEAPKQKSLQPILFLSRQLTSAETRYWPTELEMAGIVWVIKKIRHLIEAASSTTIVYTDHTSAIGIVRQTSMNTTSTEKLNLRLIRASEYLQRFRIELRHKPGKANIVPDALSRLASRSYRPETDELILNALTAFPVNIIAVSEDFKSRVRSSYEAEARWVRIMATVVRNAALGENEAKLPYKLVDGLLYFDDVEYGHGLRLCLPAALEREVFQKAHNEMGHPGYARTHEKLTRSVYIFNMSTKLHEYLRYCPHYQLHQTPRHQPYGSLQPIYSPCRPFETITINFILALPEASTGEDYVISVTYKFSKAVTLIAGKVAWGGPQWAHRLLVRLLLLNWGLPSTIISDRDTRFIGQLWKQIMTELNVNMLYSTAYHPQTDGQSEKSNEVVEIALRYFLLTVDAHKWPVVLPQLSAALNNSTKYSSTRLAPIEILYGFKIKEPLDLLRISNLNIS